MKSTALLEADSSETLSHVEQLEAAPVPGEESNSYSKIETLKDLTFRILREVQSMHDVSTPSIDSGIDFYDEVTRFEIDLIKRALLHTGGHQGRAARLLNLKITTLNSKIKHYGIELAGFATGYPFGNPANGASRQHA
jgi:transcriptional regulator with GAF, ATPase, and Fis domain